MHVYNIDVCVCTWLDILPMPAYTKEQPYYINQPVRNPSTRAQITTDTYVKFYSNSDCQKLNIIASIYVLDRHPLSQLSHLRLSIKLTTIITTMQYL